MSKFTPGEWKHEGDGVITAEDGKQIVSVFPRDRLANAYLIAKSPRMYKLLEEITTTELNAETLYILQPWLNKVLAILEDTP